MTKLFLLPRSSVVAVASIIALLVSMVVLLTTGQFEHPTEKTAAGTIHQASSAPASHSGSPPSLQGEPSETKTGLPLANQTTQAPASTKTESPAKDQEDAAHPRWPGSRLIEKALRPSPENPQLYERITLLQPQKLPYPVRIVETLDGSDEAAKVIEVREMVANRVIVELPENVSEQQWQTLLAELGAQIGESVKGRRLMVLQLPAISLDGLPRALSRLNSTESPVAYAEPDYIVRSFATFPDDTRFEEQYHLHNTAQSGGTTDADIDAPEAWEKRSSALGIILAIIDTGLRLSHRDLKANLWVNPGEIPDDGLDNDGNGWIDDIHGVDTVANTGNPNDTDGHGTHVAGIAGAVGNNGRGITGVAWNLQLMPVRFLTSEGGSLFDALEALDYARQMGARITNNSWGGGELSQSLFNTIDDLRQAGILFVAAAGNEGSDNDATPTYPASYDLDNIVSVASTDSRDRLSSFSNYGLQTVDVAAPGSSILSTFNGNDDDYRQLSGTSMASPVVAGMAALLMEEFSEDTYLETRQRILLSADSIASLDERIAHGRANLRAALNFDQLGDLPRIEEALYDLVAAEGASFSLRISASGTAPLSYRWWLNGREIPGATEPELPLTEVTTADAGTYLVQVSNDFGTVSSSMELTVVLPIPDVAAALGDPSMDWFNFSDSGWAPAIGQGPQGGDAATGSLYDSTRTADMFAYVLGPGTFTFSWRQSTSFFNSDYLAFQVNNSLEELYDNGDGGNWQEITYDLPAGEHFLIFWHQRRSFFSTSQAFLANVSYLPDLLPPVILQDPTDIETTAGSEIRLEVSADGGEPLEYQWRKDGIAIAGANEPVFVLTSARPEDSGGYLAVVSNPAGSVSSIPAVVRVLQSPSQVAYDNWASQFFPDLQAPEAQLTGDPDGDRLRNLLEAWLDTNPLVHNASPLQPRKTDGQLTLPLTLSEEMSGRLRILGSRDLAEWNLLLWDSQTNPTRSFELNLSPWLAPETPSLFLRLEAQFE